MKHRRLRSLFDNWEQIAKAFDGSIKKHYEHWERVSTRIVNHPAHYISWSTYLEAVQHPLGLATYFHKADYDFYMKILKGCWPDLMFCHYAGNHAWPTYLVSEQIFHAVNLTDPPEIWDMEGASKIPFDGLSFLLHDKCLNVEGDPIQSINICKVDGSNPYIAFQEFGVNGILVTAWTQNGRSLFCCYKVVENEEGRMIVDTNTAKGQRVHLDSPVNHLLGPITSEEEKIMDIIGPIALQFVTIMNHCGELVESGEIRKRARKTKKEIWEPCWIGKRFVIPKARPKGDGSAASDDGGSDHQRKPIEPHFRRGHWRGVRFGEKRAQLRQQWFPPCFVKARDHDE